MSRAMRAGFFPFVEPGFEIDMQCLVCEEQDAPSASASDGEVMPGGPPHPRSCGAAGV